jgi:hypothetical protein
MSRMTDLSAAVVIPAARHCAEPGCRKCRARSRWLRAGRGAPVSPRTVPPATGRGDVR